MTKRQGRSVWNRLYHGPAGRILLAALIAFAALAAFSLVQQITYLTNDDNAIAYTLAGYHTGTPAPYALFTNCLLGYLVSALYLASPAVPWWAALQIGCIACSMTVIGGCILRTCAKRDVPLIVSVALCGALFALLMLQPVVELTYTVTASILGGAGVALTISAPDSARARTRTVFDVLGALAVFGAFLYREETGYAVLCYFFAACVYRAVLAVTPESDAPSVSAEEQSAVRQGGGRAVWRAAPRVGALFIATLVLCMGALAFNNAMQTAYHGQEYRTFFHYRERFTDYPRDSFAQNPTLYESVGWDEPLYHLADDWCFLDARINADTLRTITDGSTAARLTLPEACLHVLDAVEGELPLRLMCAFLLCTWVFALYGYLSEWRRFLPLAGVSALLLGTAALCLLLALRGRFLARTFPVVGIPCCVAALMLALRAYPVKGKGARAALCGFTCIAVVLALLSGLMQAKELRVNSPKYLLAESRAVTRYALDHPGDVFIRDVYVVTDVDALTTYPTQKPTNLLSWGGCEMRSATAERQLVVNGLKSRYADALFEDNVYFITRTGSAEQLIMEDYLKAAYGGARLTWIADISGEIAVYRAVRQAPIDAGNGA